MSKVSVIIPAYNHERFVGAAVASVFQQTHDDLELIVVDDGSSDGTGSVVQAFHDPRLRYVYQENQDAYNALNRGLGMAAGEFIAILNSDDVYAENRLEYLLEEQWKSGAQCLFTKVAPIDDNGAPLDDPALWWNQWYADSLSRYQAADDLYTAFLQRNFLVTTSNLFLTREAAQTVGPFCALRYLHDYDYMFRLLLAFPGKVRFLAEAPPLLSYRIHGGNTISEAAITGRLQDQEVIRKYLLARVPEEYRALVAAGVGRLAELARELAEERVRRGEMTPPGLRKQVKNLLETCLTRFKNGFFRQKHS